MLIKVTPTQPKPKYFMLSHILLNLGISLDLLKGRKNLGHKFSLRKQHKYDEIEIIWSILDVMPTFF